MKTEQPKTPYLLELHFKRPLYSEMTHLKNSDDTYQYLRDHIDIGLINHKEFFWVILLTNSNRILGLKEVSSGKTHSTTISFKTILQVTLLANARTCILVHNHPSGKLKPSQNDLAITKRAKKALKLIDVELLDHIIITQEGYYSFVENDHINHP